MAQRQMEYDGDLSQLASMRALVREVCRESWNSGLADEDLIGRLVLALSEAASNIILHGFEDSQQTSLTLSIQTSDDQACVTLRHRGKAFNPEATAAPNFDGSQESGFGLYLIRECVDEVRYFQDAESRCVVQLVQKRQHKGAAHEDRG